MASSASMQANNVEQLFEQLVSRTSGLEKIGVGDGGLGGKTSREHWLLFVHAFKMSSCMAFLTLSEIVKGRSRVRCMPEISMGWHEESSMGKSSNSKFSSGVLETVSGGNICLPDDVMPRPLQSAIETKSSKNPEGTTGKRDATSAVSEAPVKPTSRRASESAWLG